MHVNLPYAVIFLEDSMLPGDKTVPADIKRRARVFANDLENIPLHLAIFWGAFIVQCFSNLSGYGQSETVGLTVLIILYSGLRFAFSLCYVLALQPFRSIFFISSQLAVGAAAIILVVSAFKVETAKFLPP